MSNRGQRPRIYDSENLCLEGSTPEDRKVFSVYRLGEDGDLLQGRCWYAFGLGVKSSLL